MFVLGESITVLCVCGGNIIEVKQEVVVEGNSTGW